MAKINVQSGGASPLDTGILQLASGAAMSSTLTAVTDQANTASPLLLSTTGVQVQSTLKITTDSNPYIDAEDGSTNNRFTVGRAPASQQVNVDFASNPGGATEVVGAIRTYANGSTLSETLSFLRNGNIGVGTLTQTARLQIKGSGSTSATTSLLVQNSGGANALKVRDDGKTAFGNSSIDCTITGTAGGGNKFEFYAFNGYDIVDGFGNVLVTGLGNTIRLPRQVGIGFNTQNNASAILQADSTTQGFLPPRMTEAQVLAIASPAIGLMAYNTDKDCPVFYSAAGWRKVSHSAM